MTQTRFALWGDLIWSQTPARLNILPGYCVVVEDGQVASGEPPRRMMARRYTTAGASSSSRA